MEATAFTFMAYIAALMNFYKKRIIITVSVYADKALRRFTALFPELMGRSAAIPYISSINRLLKRFAVHKSDIEYFSRILAFYNDRN